MKFRRALIATFASMIGCGDNSNECGPGTQAMDGLCTPTSTATCSDGTILDTASGGCVIDPTACQDGTVLIGAACVDPGHVTRIDARGADEHRTVLARGRIDHAATASGVEDRAVGACGSGSWSAQTVHRLRPWPALVGVVSAPDHRREGRYQGY